MTSREDWQRRLGPLYGGAVALVHSTPWRWPSEVGDDARSSGWIVALGVPVGLVAWLAARLVTAAGVTHPIAALVGLAMLSLASAALVERGLAEAIDRWQGQGRSPGVVSVMVLVFAILIRAAALLAIPPDRWLLVLVATAVVGRWAAVFLQAIGDPIAHDERRRSLVAIPSPAWLSVVLGLVVAAVAVFALGKLGILTMALTAIGVFVLGLATQARDGGLTPHVVAVAAAIGELLVLVTASIR